MFLVPLSEMYLILVQCNGKRKWFEHLCVEHITPNWGFTKEVPMLDLSDRHQSTNKC